MYLIKVKINQRMEYKLVKAESVEDAKAKFLKQVKRTSNIESLEAVKLNITGSL